MLGPDARVEHAHNDSFARALPAPEGVPDGGRPDEAGARFGVELEQLVGVDPLDSSSLATAATDSSGTTIATPPKISWRLCVTTAPGIAAWQAA